MKYIRTKDKIIDTTNVDRFSLYFELSGERNVPFSKIDELLEKMILNQADTIEELCDEYVAIYKDENKSARVLEAFGDYRQLDEKQLIYNIKNGWNIYGAIWTNKGLIYVAKMNDKGELELL